jgi:hypothetical protein
MITSWPDCAAAIPPFSPRQLMTTAPGGSPPSRISSQPTSRRPLAVRKASICLVNQACSSASFCKPCARINCWISALAFHCVLTASSPPM